MGCCQSNDDDDEYYEDQQDSFHSSTSKADKKSVKDEIRYLERLLDSVKTDSSPPTCLRRIGILPGPKGICLISLFPPSIVGLDQNRQTPKLNFAVRQNHFHCWFITNCTTIESFQI